MRPLRKTLASRSLRCVTLLWRLTHERTLRYAGPNGTSTKHRSRTSLPSGWPGTQPPLFCRFYIVSGLRVELSSILTGMWGWWGMDGPYSDARVKGGRNRQVRTLALQVRVCVWLRALGWEQTSSRTSIRRWVRTHHGRNERDSLRAGGLSESVRRAACRQKKAKRLNSDGEEESEEEAEVLDGLDPSNQEATYKSDAYSGAFHYTRYRRRL